MIPLATLHPYVYEFDAIVDHINEDSTVELDKTFFYATGGGQPNDMGIVKRNDDVFNVIDVRKKDGHIAHVLDRQGLEAGDKVHCIIDRERREKHRRMHTAAHLLCAIVERNEHAIVTGNQIGMEKTRIDFNIENFDQERMKRYIEEVNQIIESNPVVRKYVTTREELLKNPKLIKLAAGFPENVHDVHMVEIEDIDVQPCGGTHVDAVAEIGRLSFLSSESRGKNNRRIYFTLSI